MISLCQRCYIKKHNLKKNEIKKLLVTQEKFYCSECGQEKKLVIEREERNNYYSEDN